ncbi:hypothetical protein ONS95_010688 [Cadophora gregata]|uniref:uncharacterized protein n=1 Tax=Cadophora gregata TaxID=51156 RepID=UPI0026DB0D0C|nr:uncharacterized protein ONS95_010688 [Cadophora gregata]KAK0122456.1 hypothetical protein ONS95_010688 [Cadophora gregata]
MSNQYQASPSPHPYRPLSMKRRPNQANNAYQSEQNVVQWNDSAPDLEGNWPLGSVIRVSTPQPRFQHASSSIWPPMHQSGLRPSDKNFQSLHPSPQHEIRPLNGLAPPTQYGQPSNNAAPFSAGQAGLNTSNVNVGSPHAQYGIQYSRSDLESSFAQPGTWRSNTDLRSRPPQPEHRPLDNFASQHTPTFPRQLSNNVAQPPPPQPWYSLNSNLHSSSPRHDTRPSNNPARHRNPYRYGSQHSSSDGPYTPSYHGPTSPHVAPHNNGASHESQHMQRFSPYPASSSYMLAPPNNFVPQSPSRHGPRFSRSSTTYPSSSPSNPQPPNDHTPRTPSRPDPRYSNSVATQHSSSPYNRQPPSDMAIKSPSHRADHRHLSSSAAQQASSRYDIQVLNRLGTSLASSGPQSSNSLLAPNHTSAHNVANPSSVLAPPSVTYGAQRSHGLAPNHPFSHHTPQPSNILASPPTFLRSQHPGMSATKYLSRSGLQSSIDLQAQLFQNPAEDQAKDEGKQYAQKGDSAIRGWGSAQDETTFQVKNKYKRSKQNNVNNSNKYGKAQDEMADQEDEVDEEEEEQGDEEKEDEDEQEVEYEEEDEEEDDEFSRPIEPRPNFRFSHNVDQFLEKQKWDQQQAILSKQVDQVNQRVQKLQREYQSQQKKVVQQPLGDAEHENYRTRKRERKWRDQEEEFIGLKNFKGRQRGWDGKRESERPGYVEEDGIVKKRRGRPRKETTQDSSPLVKHGYTENQSTPGKKPKAAPAKKAGRHKEAATEDSSPVQLPLAVTIKQYQDDIDNFRTRTAMGVIAIEEAAAEADRQQRAYSGTIKWDYDIISSGGLRDDTFKEDEEKKKPPSSFRGTMKASARKQGSVPAREDQTEAEQGD